MYIGKAGTITQSGNFRKQTLKSNNNSREDAISQDYFDKKFDEKKIDGFDIYWFVTMDRI